MENDIQEVDLTNYNEEVNDNESQPEVDVEKLKETNSKLYARTKQAEQDKKELLAKLKEYESKGVHSTQTSDSVSREDLDLAILRTVKGYDDDSIEQLKVISKGKGVSLIQAQEDELFKLALSKKEADKKATQAKLGASRGASSTQAQKISEMSREEHMEYVKKMMGN